MNEQTRKALELARDALTRSSYYDPEPAIYAIRAALSAPDAPVASTDVMPASASERHLRRLLAARVAIPGAYYDDGEAHGTEHGIQIDFMREPVADIDAKLRALNVARAECAAPADPVSKPVPDAVAAELDRIANEPPISGNKLAQTRVQMAAANMRANGIRQGADDA